MSMRPLRSEKEAVVEILRIMKNLVKFSITSCCFFDDKNILEQHIKVHRALGYKKKGECENQGFLYDITLVNSSDVVFVKYTKNKDQKLWKFSIHYEPYMKLKGIC